MKGHDFQGTPVPAGTSLLLSKAQVESDSAPRDPPSAPEFTAWPPGGPHLLGRLGDRGHEGVFLRVLHLLRLLQLVPCGSVWHGRHAGEGGRKGAERPGRGTDGDVPAAASPSRAPRPPSTIAESAAAAAAALRQGAGPGEHLRQHAPAELPTSGTRGRTQGPGAEPPRTGVCSASWRNLHSSLWSSRLPFVPPYKKAREATNIQIQKYV